MKNICILFLVLSGSFCFAQGNGAFGFRAGLNYGSTGDLTQDSSNLKNNPDDNIGYHFGFFAKADLGPIYFRPELLYTRLLNDYEVGRLNTHKIDAPLLFGINVIGPLNIFAGPSLQYIFDMELDELDFAGNVFDFDNIEDRFTVGAQIGASVYFNNLEVGLRYERSLNENVATFAANNGLGNIEVDSRVEQLILALSLQL
jgi:hypothetical protein